MNNRERGIRGEIAAKKYLQAAGYDVLEVNYKTKLGEIDIIFADDTHLIFGEVKYRSGERFGAPAEAVGYVKQKKIAQAASLYISRHDLYNVPVRFDVIEITDGNIRHIKNAFDSYLRY